MNTLECFIGLQYKKPILFVPFENIVLQRDLHWVYPTEKVMLRLADLAQLQIS